MGGLIGGDLLSCALDIFYLLYIGIVGVIYRWETTTIKKKYECY